MSPLLVSFRAGDVGPWRIDRVDTVTGEGLAAAERLVAIEGPATMPVDGAVWTLRGATSNTRYAHRSEVTALEACQEPLRRARAVCAALIPIRKSPAWWDLAQDERRTIFEAESRHIHLGLQYLPAIPRRLHHGRELGEPFDFLTWFEYAPEHGAAFEELVGRLRRTTEWRYVEREVDIRLTRIESS